MRTWKHTIDVNRYLGDESLPLRERAALTIETLNQARGLFVSPLDRHLKAMSTAVLTEDWDQFDAALEAVYYTADRERIRLG